MFRFLDVQSYFTRVGFAFRALSARNFRYFFIGQTTSLIGSFIQNIALGWLVYRLTNSSFLLGVVGFAGQIPSLILTPFAGVFADRWNRRVALLATQGTAMLLSLVMALLIFTDHITVWHIVVVALLNGSVTAFDTPFRHAFLFDLVGDKQLLSNAIAMNSTMINSARFIGPMVGGALIAAAGEGWCFLINGGSYLAVIIALLAVKTVSSTHNKGGGSVLQELRSGLRYANQYEPIRYLLLMVGLVSFIGMPFQVFLPVFARDILSGDARAFGFMTGAIGAGALIGAFYLATRKRVTRFPLQIYIFALTFGIGLVCFSLSRWLWLSIPILLCTGLGMIAMFASTNTYLQAVVKDSMRGRVIALYGMTFMGITPLGSLLLGAVSKAIGVSYTVLISGVVTIAVALIFRKKVTRIIWLARHDTEAFDS